LEGKSRRYLLPTRLVSVAAAQAFNHVPALAFSKQS
jgi:hypothetical protein